MSISSSVANSVSSGKQEGNQARPRLSRKDPRHLSHWLHRNVRTQRVRADKKISLEVATAGTLAPDKSNVVVMLHGFPESWYEFRNQMKAAVGAGYYVVAPNFRGFPGSDKPTKRKAYNTGVAARDVAHVLQSMGIDRALFLAHDWGTTVALNLAEDTNRQHLVAGLVKMNSVYGPAFLRELVYNPEQRKRASYMLKLAGSKGASNARANHNQMLREPLENTFVEGAYTPQEVQTQMAMYDRATINATVNYYDQLLRLPSLRRLLKAGALEAVAQLRPLTFTERIRKMYSLFSGRIIGIPAVFYLEHFARPTPYLGPVQSLVATNDQYLTPGTARLPHRNFPAARTRMVESSHFIPNEAPELVNQVLLDMARKTLRAPNRR